MKRGLIIHPYFATMIVNGLKTWEIRPKNTNIRDKIGICAMGTNLIIGEAEIVDSFPLTKELYEDNYLKHRVRCRYDKLPQNYKVVWVLENAKVYEKPLVYEHKQGQQVWVKL